MRRLPTVMLVLLTAPGPAGCIVIDDPNDPQSDTGEAGGATMAGDETNGGACFVSPDCDPLSSDCADQERCVPNGGVFQCVATMLDADEAVEGEACANTLGCQPGLTCVAGTGCVGAAGCCISLCDVTQPQCPGDTTCMAYFGDASPPCYEDVGVCL